MSIRGSFYALTDDQLAALLSGSLDGDAFLGERLHVAPAEKFSGGEAVWCELTKLLDPEDGCGAQGTEVVPEGGAFSNAEEVRRTFTKLSVLPHQELERRYAALETDFSWEQIHEAIRGLIQFYHRAAMAGHAMLFNLR
jgi:Domain of unknown function (DUF1877)